MRMLIDGKSRFLVVATLLVAFFLVAVVAGQAPEPVSSGQDRIEVVSPAGATIFEGNLRFPD